MAQLLTVLLVDDDPNVLSLMADLLRMDGHEVSACEDGRTALALFGALKFDLVVTDRIMPAMDGEKLALAIKSRSPETPVILISGMPPPEACPGVDAILAKPFSHALLTATMARVLNGSAP